MLNLLEKNINLFLTSPSKNLIRNFLLINVNKMCSTCINLCFIHRFSKFQGSFLSTVQAVQSRLLENFLRFHCYSLLCHLCPPSKNTKRRLWSDSRVILNSDLTLLQFSISLRTKSPGENLLSAVSCNSLNLSHKNDSLHSTTRNCRTFSTVFISERRTQVTKFSSR